MCYHSDFGRSALEDIGVDTGEPPPTTTSPKNGERMNSALLGRETWLTQDTCPPDMCCHVKCGSSATKGVRINRSERPNFECWDPAPGDRGVAHPLKTSQSPYVSNLVVLRQRMYV